MTSREVLVKTGVGLHARPAALLAERAKSFSSDVSIHFNGKTASAKSILQVLALGVKDGRRVLVCADGDDEVQAVSSLVDLLKGWTVGVDAPGEDCR